MQGEASRVADRESRDAFAKRLSASGDDAWEIGNELFTVTFVLDKNPRLQRALTDPGRPTQDKVRLLNELLGGKVLDMTMEILTDLVGRSWSRTHDIDNAVEDFAVDAMMYQADKDGKTLQVSIELAKLQSALLNLPVVRADLSDDDGPIEARYELLHALIDGAGFDRITVRLAEHSTRNPRNRRYLETIQWLINKFSRHMGESMVTVTTAAPLTDAQVERLTKIYTKKVGRPVHIHLVVDANVIGGMRVQVGDEVTDNTVVAQLQTLRRKVKVGTAE
ncbi:F0F1 ATP synthase subunit delta [uncultured Bifidobacterium sp.]|uniref:F0F1 ATP synthase subunit delta n=1 Tax=uncultured Bifidobacterium sp. TaxID=165187 RepID=UPI0025884A4A|nr:F0F1 ATP synthase subunit delta [uncultured Bifidobacterium sp.]MEE0655030.1 F0F1 ATP synthase subunit delta [Bifidobacterium criceti]